MQKLINGYTLEEINAYRSYLIEEALCDALDCKRLGFHDMVTFYEEKADSYLFEKSPLEIAFLMELKCS